MSAPAALLFLALSLALWATPADGSCASFPITPMDTKLPQKPNATHIFPVGIFGTFSAIPMNLQLTVMAIDNINSMVDLVPGVLFTLFYAETNASLSNALLAPQTLIETQDVRALIGGVYSSETRVGQLVSKVYSVPEVAATPLSTILSNKAEYPFLVRTIPPDQYEAAAIAAMFKMYDWRQAMVVYTDDEFGTTGISNIQAAVRGMNVTLYSNEVVTGASNFSVNVETITYLMDLHDLRIVVMYTQANEADLVMKALSEIGYVSDKYSYILTFGAGLSFFSTNFSPPPYQVGAVMVGPSGGVPGPVLSAITALWNTYNTNPIPNAPLDPGVGWLYIDAVLTIAYSVQELMAQGVPFESIRGTTLLNAMRAAKFEGTTGPVFFDQNGDRQGNYSFFNMGAGPINQLYPSAVFDSSAGEIFMFGDGVKFNGKTTPPSDGYCLCFHGTCNALEVCECFGGYHGPTCAESSDSGFSHTAIILVSVIPSVFVAAIVMAAIQFTRYKKGRMIKDMAGRQRSVINRKDIVLKERIGRGAAGEVFKAMLRGTEVAVKRLVTTDTSREAIEEFELESAIMAGLRHPNIVLFMGSCFVAEEKEMLLVMELMERGSLHDVLHNPKIGLSRELCLHIAYQAAKGMNFLHQSSPPIIHRDLKSHNILMDDKWNARISDFGITKIKSLSKNTTSKQDHERSLGTIYWTSPEIFDGKEHSEASDCYAFGIVMWELFHRETPFGGREPMLVAMEVSKGLSLNVGDHVDPAVKDLMTECWSFKPADRPSFETIMERIKGMMGSSPSSHSIPYMYGGGATVSREVEAPTGVVFLVFTEIEGALDLWDTVPMHMLKAIKLHNALMRQHMGTYNGYEVEHANNRMFVAFPNLIHAINWCIAVQNGLLQCPWPKEIIAQPLASEVKVGGKTVWSGLRVRMALHTAVPNCEVDKTTGRMTYLGPSVERVKKLLYATNSPASILVTSTIMDQINKKGMKFTEDLHSMSCGEMLDSMRNKTEAIYKIVPLSLAGRHRESAAANNALPHSVSHSIIMDAGADVEDMETEDGTKRGSPTLHRSLSFRVPVWDIPYSAIEEKERVGKGGVGDFYHCIWRGQDVTAKVLLNQKLEEGDVLALKARAAVLSKLRHKNILDFHGVCLDEGHLALIVGYLPRASLTTLLADSTFQLNFASKVKIARQIAEGMEYLSNDEHDWIQINPSFKTSNVLLVRDRMEVKLCDIGQGNLKDLARTMTSVGTVAWTAPEILNGEPLTPAISIYAFGIMLWEILTRKVPYQNEHPIKVVSKIISGYRPIIPLDCPIPYKELVMKCWDADISHRPSWKEIRSTLETMPT